MTQPSIRIASRSSCLLCGSGGMPLHRNLVDALYHVAGKWHISRCSNQNCGLCWLDPAPVEADIPLLYQKYYTHDATNRRASLLWKIRPFFYRCYLIATYPPAWLLGLSSARREIDLMFLNDVSPGELLDVGCGDGNFMYRMHKLGWSVTGLDFDAGAIEHAKLSYPFKFLHCDLAGAHFGENSFDAITLSHVIEHVPDPVGLLAEAMRILKPGGTLVAITPNAGSYGHLQFGDCWRGLEPPRHIQIFTLEALRACARQAGFEIVNVFSSAANADGITVGSLRIRKAKRQAFVARTTMSVNVIRSIKGLLFQYREAFCMRRHPEYGEEAVLICRK